MDRFPQTYYDPLLIALGGDIEGRLQGFIDETLAVKYNKLELDGFVWNPDMQTDFTYEQIEREVGMNVMASYVDLDSPAIPYSGSTPSIGTGRIPRMKGVEFYNEDKLRKLKIEEERFGSDSSRVISSARRGIYDVFDRLVGGHTNALTYQRHQVVSKGKFTLTDTNNPNGIQNVTFASHVPAANITTLSSTKRWWTSVADGVYSSEGSASDPIGDLKAIVKKARNLGIRGHFEVQNSYMDQVLGHSKVVAAIKSRFAITHSVTAADLEVGILGRDTLIANLEAIIGCPIKTIDSLVSVEKWDNTNKLISKPTFEAFDDNVFVFVPDGTIGEILTVEPIALNGGTYANYYEGRLLITIDVDAVKKCQGYYSEMTSLVVPNRPKQMFYLHPYSAN